MNEIVHVYRSVPSFDHLVFAYGGTVKTDQIENYIENTRNPATMKEGFITTPVFPEANRITLVEKLAKAPAELFTHAESGIKYVPKDSPGIQFYFPNIAMD